MNTIKAVTKTKFCINDREFDTEEEAEAWQTHCVIDTILYNCYDQDDEGVYSKSCAVKIIQQLIDNGYTTKTKLTGLISDIKKD